MPRFAFVLLLTAAALAACSPTPTPAPPSVQPSAPSTPAAIRVQAPSEWRDALHALAREHQTRTGELVALHFGPDEAGDSPHIVITSGVPPATPAARGGPWLAPVALARNGLCLLSAEPLTLAPATVLGTLLRTDVRAGRPAPGSPAGDAALQLMHQAEQLQPGARATLTARTRLFPDSSAGTQAVAQGQINVFLGDCASARVAQRTQPRLRVTPMPPVLAVETRYHLALRQDAPPAARRFAQALREAPARQPWRNHGFDAP
ncbi:MAG: substrate-binding domain-containing protein [Comamonadaceae bacterium]|nr:substrate-binding domain-containing protein [Comamonadaceae bacterium]